MLEDGNFGKHPLKNMIDGLSKLNFRVPKASGTTQIFGKMARIVLANTVSNMYGIIEDGVGRAIENGVESFLRQISGLESGKAGISEDKDKEPTPKANDAHGEAGTSSLRKDDDKLQNDTNVIRSENDAEMPERTLMLTIPILTAHYLRGMMMTPIKMVILCWVITDMKQ